MTSFVLLVTKVTCIWTFWGMWHHVFLQLAHCWAHLLTNCAMKLFWRYMQAHVDIQCVLIFVYLFAQWTGESLSSKLICIPWSQTVNILYNYSRIHGVFFLYNSAVRHSYKNDTLGYRPGKKRDILMLCYSICHKLCQNSSTSDLFGIIYTSARTLKLIVYFIKKRPLCNRLPACDGNIVSGQMNVLEALFQKGSNEIFLMVTITIGIWGGNS